MKKKILQMMRAVIFLLLLGICIWKMSELVERKDSDFKYRPFYEQKEDFDVLFMGTSHVINAVFPMELWQRYGIVSYNFGGHGNMLPTTYWVMMNALDHTSPKLMVIDVLETDKNEKIPGTAEQARLSLDSIPLSVTKYRAVKDLFGEAGYEETEKKQSSEKWEYLFDLAKYHSRWNELSKDDFDRTYKTVEKGGEMRIRVGTPDSFEIIPAEQMLKEDTVGMDYLRRMIEECQKRGIQVLLTHLPYPADAYRQEAANAVYAIAEEYGVDYLNFVAMGDVVDYETDCYDTQSHLNVSGGNKVTAYLGEYITENYDIPDRRKDSAYSFWDRDYKAFKELKDRHLVEEEDLNNELMLLADRDYDSIVYIKGGSVPAQDGLTGRLLDNAAAVKGVLTKQAAAGTYYCFGGYAADPEAYPLSYSTDEAVWEPDVMILVFDSQTGGLVQSAFWDTDENGAQQKLN